MAATTAQPTVDEDRPQLKRVLGPRLLTFFILGDVLGTGIYTLTGDVAAEVGGAVWIPFLAAFAVALLTAGSYLELVTKYPRAAGAAFYTHKAFGIHVLSFLVCFTVMTSGITSASTASVAFSRSTMTFLGVEAPAAVVVTLVALVFMVLVAAVNLRGVGESVAANAALTAVELAGLLIVLGIGAYALLGGQGDPGVAGRFDLAEGASPFGAVTAATALAFFALVGFEDSVNMAEETHEPRRTFPRAMLTALCIAGALYILIGVVAVSLVPLDALGEGNQPLLQVVEAGAPGFPLQVFAFITMVAVGNSALLNMLMASRLLYGMARSGVVPAWLGRILNSRRTPWTAIVFSTCLSLILIVAVAGAPTSAVLLLGGTTSLLLLTVFAVVHVCVLRLRRDRVEHDHVRVPTIVPVVGFLVCAYLVTPFVDRDPLQYVIAGSALALGLVLWGITVGVRRARA